MIWQIQTYHIKESKGMGKLSASYFQNAALLCLEYGWTPDANGQLLQIATTKHTNECTAKE